MVFQHGHVHFFSAYQYLFTKGHRQANRRANIPEMMMMKTRLAGLLPPASYQSVLHSSTTPYESEAYHWWMYSLQHVHSVIRSAAVRDKQEKAKYHADIECTGKNVKCTTSTQPELQYGSSMINTTLTQPLHIDICIQYY